ncbi:relaxase/mobilization nuclease domain-containing protein [Streptococcus sanguinis]|uniref:helical hairpin domain-containing protein n=1 Tax=Streptococcus sanguinis TaxID=1305 RepID=UPI001CC0DF58|nr:relaxase/mobilization nuclease domain-containing protein [Streptococcus sanguinis]MBZ2023036.1 relaxase/mobilization nuclease domain-containing protein [Streptococcus sanguinis]MBZ2049170.1 relaxase/mobilization nuclease domain-containing protein [Streptococcus sanguinis]MBZ2051895.1 relaxase/mobilization nuclease domain-containing protein [Streptococcus sanguinis]MBZ2059303.1 relaxase/mobilization nuclease domain-containing protein [Streptococcus sanguinis]MCC3176732.1 relaxase/mobilizatio
MVVTKAIQIKNTGNLKRAVKYILDEAKTVELVTNSNQSFPVILKDGKLQTQLVSGHLIGQERKAAEEFILTKKLADTRFGRKETSDLVTEKGVLAHHLIQSFDPSDNLTAEEIHEIGRKTVLELTKGKHEFVIATHVDKNHIHNHIIFNTTDTSSLKKFRWQKGTKRSLEKISDRYAELAGAKIIDRSAPRFSHTKYAAYQKKNVFKLEIKSRLNFLIKHSTSLEDFLKKAEALNLAVNFSGKHATYRLLDSEQQRNTRDSTLSKKGAYTLATIEKRVSQNKATYSLEDIKPEYDKLQQEKAEDFEQRLMIEPWQVKEVTADGIYLEIDFGIRNHGLIKVPHRQVDQLEDGRFELFVRRNDFFYFLNPDHSENNRYIKGNTLMKQMAYNNGEVVLTKNRNIFNLDQLIKEFEFLAAHDVTSGQQFEELEERFIEQLDQTEETLQQIDQRLIKLNKAAAALSDLHSDNPEYQALGQEILESLGFPLTIRAEELEKEITEISVEQAGLQQKYDGIVGSFEEYQSVKDNNQVRREKEQESSL